MKRIKFFILPLKLFFIYPIFIMKPDKNPGSVGLHGFPYPEWNRRFSKPRIPPHPSGNGRVEGSGIFPPEKFYGTFSTGSFLKVDSQNKNAGHR
jgi:hypothetical protein